MNREPCADCLYYNERFEGRNMKVLIACEESQTVCKAFRAKGHEAYSCDIIEPSGGHPEWHIKGDVLPLLNGNCTFQTLDTHTHTIAGQWDMIIAFPPCTYLSNVATRQYSLKCCPAEKVIARWEERAKAAVFFMQFALANCDKVAIENPVGFMNSAYRKADQIIHPYYFAESEADAENYHKKRTCLWLRGLPTLTRKTDLPEPEPMYICKGEKSSGKKIGWCEGMRNIKGGQPERAKARSKTFPAIAQAMADQWG